MYAFLRDRYRNLFIFSTRIARKIKEESDNCSKSVVNSAGFEQSCRGNDASLRDRSAPFGGTVSRTRNNVTEIAPNMLTPMHIIIVMSTTSLASATCVCPSLQWPIQRRGLRNPVAAETSHCVAARDAQHPRSTKEVACCYRALLPCEGSEAQ